MHRLSTPLLLLCAPALLLGCSQHGPPMSPAQGQWRFARIDGERPVGETALISFSDDRLGVTVGCNRLAGPWHLDADRLVAGPLDQGDERCPTSEGDHGWDQGNAVGALLVSVPQVSFTSDRMVLHSGGHRVELVRDGA